MSERTNFEDIPEETAAQASDELLLVRSGETKRMSRRRLISHNHDTRYSQQGHDHDADYAATDHTHSAYALADHTHDSSGSTSDPAPAYEEELIFCGSSQKTTLAGISLSTSKEVVVADATNVKPGYWFLFNLNPSELIQVDSVDTDTNTITLVDLPTRARAPNISALIAPLVTQSGLLIFPELEEDEEWKSIRMWADYQLFRIGSTTYSYNGFVQTEYHHTTGVVTMTWTGSDDFHRQITLHDADQYDFGFMPQNNNGFTHANTSKFIVALDPSLNAMSIERGDGNSNPSTLQPIINDLVIFGKRGPVPE